MQRAQSASTSGMLWPSGPVIKTVSVMLLMLVEPATCAATHRPSSSIGSTNTPKHRFTARADSGKRATGIQTRNGKEETRDGEEIQ